MKLLFVALLSWIPALIAGDEALESRLRDLKGASKKGRPSLKAVISIGNKRPESITKGPRAPIVYVSQIAYGGVVRVNVRTGKVKQIVGPYSYLERAAVGTWYYKGALFVGGAGVPDPFNVDPILYVYDAKDGKELAACKPDYKNPVFINDVVVRKGMAYATDSGANRLMVVNARKAIKGKCEVSSIPLPRRPFRAEPGDFRANGIDAYHMGLIVVSSAGGLYYVDVKSAKTTKLSDDETLAGSDGVAVHGDLLYIGNNSRDSVAVWKLSHKKRKVQAKRLGDITSKNFDSPAGVVAVSGDIVTANARFASLGFPAEGEGDPDFPETFNVVTAKGYSQ